MRRIEGTERERALGLHARRKITHLRRGKPHPLVFLRIGQPRVHRKQRRRVAPDAAGAQKAFGARRPKGVVGDGKARFGEGIPILRERIAADEHVGASRRRIGKRDGEGLVDPVLHRARGHDGVGRQAMRAGAIDHEERRIDLFAHRIGSDDHRSPVPRFPRAPSHGIKRRNAEQRDFETRRDSLGGGHAAAHAREAAGTAAAHDGDDVVLLDVLPGHQLIDHRDEHGVARAMGGTLLSGNEARRNLLQHDATRFCSIRIDGSYADDDGLVRRIECEDVSHDVSPSLI